MANTKMASEKVSVVLLCLALFLTEGQGGIQPYKRLGQTLASKARIFVAKGTVLAAGGAAAGPGLFSAAKGMDALPGKNNVHDEYPLSPITITVQSVNQIGIPETQDATIPRMLIHRLGKFRALQGPTVNSWEMDNVNRVRGYAYPNARFPGSWEMGNGNQFGKYEGPGIGSVTSVDIYVVTVVLVLVAAAVILLVYKVLANKPKNSSRALEPFFGFFANRVCLLDHKVYKL